MDDLVPELVGTGMMLEEEADIMGCLVMEDDSSG